MRGFVSPGELLTINAKHEGSGFAVTSAKVRSAPTRAAST
jgi:hypothetical protein